jgi:hypothetical protein
MEKISVDISTRTDIATLVDAIIQKHVKFNTQSTTMEDKIRQRLSAITKQKAPVFVSSFINRGLAPSQAKEQAIITALHNFQEMDPVGKYITVTAADLSQVNIYKMAAMDVIAGKLDKTAVTFQPDSFFKKHKSNKDTELAEEMIKMIAVKNPGVAQKLQDNISLVEAYVATKRMFPKDKKVPFDIRNIADEYLEEQKKYVMEHGGFKTQPKPLEGSMQINFKKVAQVGNNSQVVNSLKTQIVQQSGEIVFAWLLQQAQYADETNQPIYVNGQDLFDYGATGEIGTLVDTLLTHAGLQTRT